jgi:serine/threonine protein kinase
MAHISDGTFGRVFECKDLEDNKIYAVKVIRAVQRYVESAKTETEILEFIKNKDKDDKFQNVKLYDAFPFG